MGKILYERQYSERRRYDPILDYLLPSFSLSIPQNAVILDAGSFNGKAASDLHYRLEELNPKIICLDIKFGRKAKNQALTFLKGNYVDTIFPNDSIDVIFMCNNISYEIIRSKYAYSTPGKIRQRLGEAVRILAPGGFIVIQSDNHDMPTFILIKDSKGCISYTADKDSYKHYVEFMEPGMALYHASKVDADLKVAKRISEALNECSEQ